MTEFVCNVCFYVRTRPGLDEGAMAEARMLTVINGQMVCVRHMPFAASNHRVMLADAVRWESSGECESVSEYQDWRRRQDTPSNRS